MARVPDPLDLQVPNLRWRVRRRRKNYGHEEKHESTLGISLRMVSLKCPFQEIRYLSRMTRRSLTNYPRRFPYTDFCGEKRLWKTDVKKTGWASVVASENEWNVWFVGGTCGYPYQAYYTWHLISSKIRQIILKYSFYLAIPWWKL